MKIKSLVLYYSLSGNTRKLATALARRLGADLEEIRCSRYKRGPWGYVRAVYDGVKGRLPPLEPPTRALADYSLVVIGGPIWAGRIAAPVRALLQREKGRMRSVAFFLTHGGSSAVPAFADMQDLVGRTPVSAIAVTQQQMEQGKYDIAVDSFAAALPSREAA